MVPNLIRPMLATSRVLPTDHGHFWAEMKWDGVRAVVYLDRGAVRVMTRNDREVLVSYPELAELGTRFASREIVLDGEIVAPSAGGRPDFGLLQRRMHVTESSAVRVLQSQVPIIYFVFDVLYLDGKLLLDEQYEARREILESLDVEGSHCGLPPVFADVDAAVQTSKAQGLEGVVAKRRGSLYEPGRRSADWIKVKNVKHAEIVIGGWRAGEGRRSGGIGALLMGIPSEGGLTYVGRVGTGFTDAALEHLGSLLAPLRSETSPFNQPLPRLDERGAVYVEPTLVGEVEYGERTADGRLRHPS